MMVDMIIGSAAKWLPGGSIYSKGMLDKEWVILQVDLAGFAVFHAIQNGIEFKTYELFLEIFI